MFVIIKTEILKQRKRKENISKVKLVIFFFLISYIKMAAAVSQPASQPQLLASNGWTRIKES